MSDIIRLLPDSVANQIAAGEVIQRPASVVKELMENALDAGATRIVLMVKDAGRTLVQVTDNGAGMSDTDARMAFERHATSKIQTANDLFALRTMGFRGEALASIASVAEVSLITRKKENELGTEININGSMVQSQQAVSCPVGSTFSVKNLFYNIPARRKFLKSNGTEIRHIINEFQRVALAYPAIEFSLEHNQTEIYSLSSGNLRQRILGIFGKSLNQHLIELNNETSLVKISGLVGKPAAARKVPGDQFFFVNGRFMRHPGFGKAVARAYDRLIQTDTYPIYFIFLDIDPSKIDINIHPTKTEIKFEDEQSIWSILHAVVKESLGKFIIAPSIDFENSGMLEIPVITRDTQIRMPEVTVNHDYNPFVSNGHHSSGTFHSTQPSMHKSKLNEGWEKLFEGMERDKSVQTSDEVLLSSSENENVVKTQACLQFKNKYILTTVKSGLMIIDQSRAHERILYETYYHAMDGSHSVAQEWLYPVDIQLNPDEFEVIQEHLETINRAGFHMEASQDNTIVVKGMPAEIKADVKEIVERLLDDIFNGDMDLRTNLHEQLARSLAKSSAIPYGKMLSMQEMLYIVDQLFACSNPNQTVDGKEIITIMATDEIEGRIK